MVFSMYSLLTCCIDAKSISSLRYLDFSVPFLLLSPVLNLFFPYFLILAKYT